MTTHDTIRGGRRPRSDQWASVQALLERHRQHLPTSPRILADLQAMLSDKTSGAAEIGALLSRDPGLVATLLGLVNSAYYGLAERVLDARLAVAYLGTNEVHRLVVVAAIANAFTRLSPSMLRSYWLQAHLTANISRRLVETRAVWLSRSCAWSVGLLHDVGALVRMKLEPEVWQEFEARRVSLQVLPEEAEEVLGLAPTPIFGGILCRAWELPGPFEIVCRSSRTGVAPAACRADTAEYVRLISAASFLARLELDALGEPSREEASRRVIDTLSIADGELRQLLVLTRELRERAEQSVDAYLVPRAV